MLESGTSAKSLARQAGAVSLATSKSYTRAVLPPAIPGSGPGQAWSVRRPAPRPDLRQDLPRLGKRRLAVRIVRAPHHVVPHHVVGADDVAQANAGGVLLEAQDDVAAEEVAREHALPRRREGRPPAFARAGS